MHVHSHIWWRCCRGLLKLSKSERQQIIQLKMCIISVLDISARPLAQASVKSVGRVQILDHLPVWRVQFSSPRNYLKIKVTNDFTLHFGKKIS